MAVPLANAGNPFAAGALTRRTLLVAFGLALLVFAASAWLGDRAARQSQDDLARVAHSRQVQQVAAAFESAVLEMEADHRAFLISGDPEILHSREDHRRQAEQALAGLLALTEDNPAQRARLQAVGAQLAARRERMTETSAVAAREGIAVARTRFRADGTGTLAPLEVAINAFDAEETRLLAQRAARAQAQTARLRAAMLWAPLIGAFLLVGGVLILWGQLRRGERLLARVSERSAVAQRALDLVDATSDAVLVYDADSLQIRYANAGAGTQVGRPRDELVARPILEIKPALTEPALRDLLAPLRDGRRSTVSFETVHRHRDGHDVPVEVRVRFVESADGERSFVTVARDISDRRAAEDERDRFFVLSVDMLCIASPDGRFVRVNPAFSAALGWSADELTARPFIEFVHPDDHAATVREVERQVRDHQPVLHFENRYRHKDGSWRVLSWRSAPHPNGLMFATARDVTERNQAEAALRESEARLRVVVDAAYDAFILMDGDGRVVEWSRRAEETFGWPAADAIGRPLDELIVPAGQRDAHRFGLARYMATGRSRMLGRVIEVIARHQDGREFPVELNVSPIRRGGSLIFGAFLRDISQRRTNEKHIAELNRGLAERTVALEAANRELESFSYSVSHDLRAPLRHIDGYVRMLVEDNADRLDTDSRRYLDVIAGSARHMGQLIDDLLALARLGRKPLEPRPIDMQALADEALAALDPMPGTVAIGALPAAAGDAVLLKQLWVNLLSNAIKYSAPRGAQARIVVSGERDGALVRYQVADNGVGFDMRYAGKLFGVFQRLHSPDEFEGTGVGLAIVQRIVTRHGGTIRAQAEPGRGATFIFELPIQEATP